ncbi:MAG: PilC/PilY family type IV pilus protein, partial [Pseudomonadota bacterium]
MNKASLCRISVAASAALFLAPGRDGGASIDPLCDQGSSPSSFVGQALDDNTPNKAGVIFDGGQAKLRLQKSGGLFQSTYLGISDLVTYTCAADFDGDGWTDFVGAADTPEQFIRFYKNQTYNSAAPDWDDPWAPPRAPSFVATVIEPPTTAADASRGGMVCADFNNDGKQDFIYLRCTVESSNMDNCYAERAHLFLGNGNGTFASPYQFLSNRNDLQRLTWGSTNMVAADYNGDGSLDLLVGAGTASSSKTQMTSKGGDVLLFLNDGSSSPQFSKQPNLLGEVGYNYRGPVAVGYADFTGDTVRDLILAGPSTNALRVYPGLLGGGVSTEYQDAVYPSPNGGGTVLLVADFSLDGKPDIIVGTDNWNWPTTNGYSTTGHVGGQTFYYRNDGDTVPFSSGVTQQLSNHQDPHDAGSLFDFDTGLVFDYDHDPDGTPDFMIADGNHSGTFFVFSNRVITQYVECGTVASGDLDVGSLASDEITVTEVRIDPSVLKPGNSTIAFEASNNGGQTWFPAPACGDDPSELCASVASTVGKAIRWRAQLCSTSDRVQTPSIDSVAVEFTYLRAETHFHAGPVAANGLIYAGGFREPGDAGRFFAIDDATMTQRWEASVILDATDAGGRRIYTVSSSNVRQDFGASSANESAFRSTLGVADADAAVAVIDWQTSARFGVNATRQVLGSIENSTPAVLSPPKKPEWFSNSATSTETRDSISEYVNTYQSRPMLVFVGTKDGALHAFRTNPADSSDASNGTEAWAFIPYDVAQRLNQDRIDGQTRAYPDGSPSLASVRINGAWRTVLVSGEGNGGRSVFALDVTETIGSGGSVLGPTPLWWFAHPNMGHTHAKPSIVRVGTEETEQWYAVFASGRLLDSDVGDSVYAVNLATGALVWQFNIDDASCYVSTDVTATETDDEPGTAIDGFVDRLFFADNKGRIWKLDASTGAVVGASLDVGLSHLALFSTADTSGALGEQRAVAGTIAAAESQEGKLMLYFGTGGTTDTLATAPNALYAVYADSGSIRHNWQPEVGFKFYGGIVYNAGQIVFSIGQDGDGGCDPTVGKIVALDAETFIEDFVIDVASKIMAPLYARGGELYTVTMKGQIV